MCNARSNIRDTGVGGSGLVHRSIVVWPPTRAKDIGGPGVQRVVDDASVDGEQPHEQQQVATREDDRQKLHIYVYM